MSFFSGILDQNMYFFGRCINLGWRRWSAGLIWLSKGSEISWLETIKKILVDTNHRNESEWTKRCMTHPASRAFPCSTLYALYKAYLFYLYIYMLRAKHIFMDRKKRFCLQKRLDRIEKGGSLLNSRQIESRCYTIDGLTFRVRLQYRQLRRLPFN